MRADCEGSISSLLWWQSSSESSKHVRTSMDHRKHRKAARVLETTSYQWGGGEWKGGEIRELVYLREQRKAVSNLAHLFHRWRLKREEGWTFPLFFCFIQVGSTTSLGMGKRGGFSVGDVVTEDRGNSHNRLERLLHFNVSPTLPKLT